MNKYQLSFTMKDGSIKYDFTSMTNETIEQVKNRYKNIIEKNQLKSLEDCISFEVEL